MANHSLLESITDLLHHENPDLQIAAVRVLGATKSADESAIKIMGGLLNRSSNSELQTAIINVFTACPHPITLKYLVQLLTRESGITAKALVALANGGDESIMALRAQFTSLPLPARRQAVSIIPLIRTAAAHQFFIDQCFAQDNELIREMLHSLREDFFRYQVREIADFHAKLVEATADPRSKTGNYALAAFIIALGIIGSVNDHKLLAGFLKDSFPLLIRRHALTSLASFEYSSTKHDELFKQIVEMIKICDFDELGRYAIGVLNKFKLHRNDNNQLHDLLNHKHIGVKIYAIRNLTAIDSVANANTILKIWHDSRDSGLRDAALNALRKIPSAVAVILRNLEKFAGSAGAYELVQVLESRGNKIADEKAMELFTRMLELYQKRREDCYQLYRTALVHLRGDILQREVCALAQKERQQKNWARVRDILRIIDHTELLTAELRFDLAVAQLKTSKLNRSRSARESDPALANFKWFLRETEKGFAEKLLNNKQLTPDEWLYLGYHFSEQINAERRFGLEMLTALAAKHPKTEVGEIAKQKLKVEGH